MVVSPAALILFISLLLAVAAGSDHQVSRHAVQASGFLLSRHSLASCSPNSHTPLDQLPVPPSGFAAALGTSLLRPQTSKDPARPIGITRLSSCAPAARQHGSGRRRSLRVITPPKHLGCAASRPRWHLWRSRPTSCTNAHLWWMQRRRQPNSRKVQCQPLRALA